jgi:hypothetical protein
LFLWLHRSGRASLRPGVRVPNICRESLFRMEINQMAFPSSFPDDAYWWVFSRSPKPEIIDVWAWIGPEYNWRLGFVWLHFSRIVLFPHLSTIGTGCFSGLAYLSSLTL